VVSVTFVYCVETAGDMAIVSMECEQVTVPKLSSGTMSVTFYPNFKVTIFSTSVKQLDSGTRELYLQRQTNSMSYSLSNGAISNDLE